MKVTIRKLDADDNTSLSNRGNECAGHVGFQKLRNQHQRTRATQNEIVLIGFRLASIACVALFSMMGYVGIAQSANSYCDTRIFTTDIDERKRCVLNSFIGVIDRDKVVKNVGPINLSIRKLDGIDKISADNEADFVTKFFFEAARLTKIKINRTDVTESNAGIFLFDHRKLGIRDAVREFNEISNRDTAFEKLPERIEKMSETAACHIGFTSKNNKITNTVLFLSIGADRFVIDNCATKFTGYTFGVLFDIVEPKNWDDPDGKYSDYLFSKYLLYSAIEILYHPNVRPGVSVNILRNLVESEIR